jgi:hypothetical protein
MGMLHTARVFTVLGRIRKALVSSVRRVTIAMKDTRLR